MPDTLPQALLIPPPLHGKAVIVRQIRADDLPAIAALYADPVFIRFIPSELWTEPAHATAWLERIEARQNAGEMVQFVIEATDGAGVIGTCLLFRLDFSAQSAELGYSLSPAYWGRGLMQEALHLLIDCAFDHFNLRRLEARVDPRNVRSSKVLTRLGFTHEGCLRECRFLKGELVDSDLFGLLRREWPPLKPLQAS